MSEEDDIKAYLRQEIAGGATEQFLRDSLKKAGLEEKYLDQVIAEKSGFQKSSAIPAQPQQAQQGKSFEELKNQINSIPEIGPPKANANAGQRQGSQSQQKAGFSQASAAPQRNSSFFGNIFGALHPKEFFAAEKPNSSFGKAIINFAIAGIVTGLIMGIVAVISSVQFLGVLAIIIYPILSAIVFPIVYFLWNIVLLVSSKILGGKGTMEQQAYLNSTYAIMLGIISAAISLLALIPTIITWIISAVASLAVIIWCIYLTTLAQKEAHGFDTTKAVVSWLLPGLVLGAIIIVVATIVAAFFMISPESYIMPAMA